MMDDSIVDHNMSDFTKAPQNAENQLSMTQIVRATNSDNICTASGRVLGIDLENFMCHKNLSMRFDANKHNCFYIVGPNGSGKSAIFAGLNIGLGGKGRSNDRGNSLHDYIKEGETTAKVRIHLSNIGANTCFEYGPEIIVERIITQSSSRYFLKSVENKHERVVSMNKRDLDKLLARFCIELENPLCWLSQDRARQFLHQMKPNKLYEIFMITSELLVTDKHYGATASSLINIRTLLAKWKEQQKAKKDNYDKLRRTLKAIGHLSLAEKSYKQLKWWMLWLPIKEAQVELREATAKYDLSLLDYEKIKLNLENRKENERELTDNKNAKQAERDKLQLESTQLSMQKKALITTNRDLQAQCSEIDRKVNIIKNDIRSADCEIAYHDRALIELMGGLDRDIVSERAELLIQLNQCRQQEQSDDTQVEMLNARKQTIIDERDCVFQRQRTALSNLRTCSDDITNVRREKAEAKRIAMDIMARYGVDTSKILECLRLNERRFDRMPIGPIGQYIHVKDRRFVSPIEKVLRFELGNYIVENAKDRRNFEQMLKHYGLKCSGIVICKFSDAKINTSARAPSNDVLTFERVLNISEPTVFNHLVDNSHIESLMLIETDTEARDIMRKNPPANVIKAYTSTCSEVLPARHNSYYRFYTNQYEAKILNEIMPTINTETDFDNRVANLEVQMTDAINKVNELKAETSKFTERIKEVDEEIWALQNRICQNNEQVKFVKKKLDQLDTVITRQAAIDNCRNALAENKEQLNVFKKQVEELTANKNTILLKINHNQAEIKDKITSSNTVCQKLSDIDITITNLNTEISEFEIDTQELERRSMFIANNLAKRLAAKEDAQKALENAERSLEMRNPDDTEKPDGVTDPPDMDQVPESKFLDEKINMAKKKVAEYRARINGAHVSEAEVAAAEQTYIEASKKVKEHEEECINFKESFEKRETLFNEVKENLPARLRSKFREYMSMRNYIGDLVVDHINGVIEITVETHKGARCGNKIDSESEEEGDVSTKRSRPIVEKKGKAKKQQILTPVGEKGKTKMIVQDLKGLSGGERSYTTACFVMALWSCVESPFRCLDEFDVFMDMVNRRVVMELLTELARRHRHIQFFFFTPQGIQELDCEDVEVFTMNKVR